MRFTFGFVAATLQTASIVNAGWTDGLCSTRLGVSSVKNVPTSTKTIGLPLTAFVKACASTTKTITPKAQTTTLTDTLTSTITTTAQQSTDTILTTSTDTITNTESFSTTIITTSTASSTVVTTATALVPAPAGFIPAASDPSYIAKKRDVPERFSLVERANSKSMRKLTFGTDKKIIFSPALYPQEVNCVKIQKDIKTKTITIPFCTKTKTRTLAPSTSTVRETVSTVTTNIEDQPVASVTSTIYITITAVTSTTSTQVNTATVTETQTSEAPAATSYAACASNNLVGSANGGQGIEELFIFGPAGNSADFVYVDAYTPYDCCVACQMATNCAGSAVIGGSTCYLIQAPRCSPGNSFGSGYSTSSGIPAGAGAIISNGACGRIANGGGSL